MEHGPCSMTSITKLFLLGGYDHVYFLKMLGGYRLTSITNFIFSGGYRPCSMFKITHLHLISP